MDTHLPATLPRGLYHADGQIQDEVYEYGSFRQSKMFHQGVTCSDCHNPHSLKLKAKGSTVCMQCHAAVKYTAPAHHHHKAGSAGSDCLACHMPTKTYMGVDVRHDHSFRVPRPDQSVSLGTPNACTACHTDKPASWAAAAVRGWLGRDARGFQTFAPALAAARASAPNAEAGLLALLDDPLQPAVVRATAAEELGAWLSPVSVQALARALNDPDPLVRGGALAGIASLPLEQRWQLAAPLLHDDVRALRIEAAGQLAGVPADRMTPEQRADMERASAEFLAAQNRMPTRRKGWAISATSMPRAASSRWPKRPINRQSSSTPTGCRRMRTWPTCCARCSATPKPNRRCAPDSSVSPMPLRCISAWGCCRCARSR